MNRIEYVPAIVLTALAIRSLVYWMRHRIDSVDATDDVLFALFVTGRVGVWLAAAGWCWLLGSIDAQGRAFTDEARDSAWLLFVAFALGGLQVIAAWFLSMRGSRVGGDPSQPGAPEAGNEPRPPIEH